MAKNKKAKAVKKKVKKAEKKEKAPPAYFLSLSVENVRCFGPKQLINFADKSGKPSKWTVILGDNNTGKTTILQNLVAMEARERKPPIDTDYLGPRCTASVPWENNWDFYRTGLKDPASISCSIYSGLKLSEAISMPIVSGAYAFTEGKEIRVLNSYANLRYKEEKLFGGSYQSYERELLGSLVCYGYGAGRKMGRTSISEGENGETSMSLLRDDAYLINAEEWLMQLDYAAKSSDSKSKIGQAAIKKREQIREVLINLLPEVDDIRITEPSKARPQPRVEFKTPYGWVPIGGLSLGYKTMVAWMVDLASRLFERYPKSKNPLAEPAIVLIDEIDLHMHPSWQRKIMDYLDERFVNTQFIVTAHSPLVVQAATDANVALLRREGDHVVIENNPQSIKGWRLDQIMMSDLFGRIGSRSPDVEKLQDQRVKLLSKGKLSAVDKKKLKEIENKLGELPTAETPEDIEAMELIRQAAKGLKKRGERK